jgi:hypothetical protein
MGFMDSISGALGGASSGASLGTALFPGVGTAIGAAVGGIAGGLGGAFGSSGSKTTSGYSIPPEYELQYIQQFQTQLGQMQQAYQQVQSLASAFSTKIDALNSIIGGGDKNEALQALQQSNYNIAQGLGMSGEDLVKNGFMTAADKADVDKMSQLAGSPDQLVKDPALEQQINQQRAQTTLDLKRQGASPAAIAQALQKYDMAAEQARFQRSQDLKSTGLNQIGQVISTRAGLRQQGFGQAQNTLNQNLGFTGQALGLLGSNYGQQLSAQNQALTMQSQIRGEQTNAFTTMGQFKFSPYTSRAIESGLTGPGTFAQQTGLSRDLVDPYQLAVRRGENSANMGGTNLATGSFSPVLQQALTGKQQVSGSPGALNPNIMIRSLV